MGRHDPCNARLTRKTTMNQSPALAADTAHDHSIRREIDAIPAFRIVDKPFQTSALIDLVETFCST